MRMTYSQSELCCCDLENRTNFELILVVLKLRRKVFSDLDIPSIPADICYSSFTKVVCMESTETELISLPLFYVKSDKISTNPLFLC